MTPDAKAFTMTNISEFAAIHLEPFAFLCIKRKAWALKGFTIAAEWLNDMRVLVCRIDVFSNGFFFHPTSRTVELVLQFQFQRLSL